MYSKNYCCHFGEYILFNYFLVFYENKLKSNLSALKFHQLLTPCIKHLP